MNTYKVVQTLSGFVKGIWYQQANSEQEAIESVKNFYATTRQGTFRAVKMGEE